MRHSVYIFPSYVACLFSHQRCKIDSIFISDTVIRQRLRFVLHSLYKAFCHWYIVEVCTSLLVLLCSHSYTHAMMHMHVCARVCVPRCTTDKVIRCLLEQYNLCAFFKSIQKNNEFQSSLVHSCEGSLFSSMSSREVIAPIKLQLNITVKHILVQ